MPIIDIYIPTNDAVIPVGNKEIVIKKFYELMTKAFLVQKKRRATKPSKGSKERRLESKKRDSGIKKLRKKDW